ncbi:putative sodium-dependent multivitamin transporter isoform X2 [Ostrea edulis]|uniref:putative sodium-dependent multivitamin transporter isoform X2 n=1 Tax=Ostrea edulis TaxID=37623 RepID=UPI0024AE94F4|nr:putative sodium-dependent multivitamin transporter isoform X2 [Ostrea edulis]
MLSEVKFAVADYIICSLALCVSIGIGLYYACSGGRQGTTTEYHLGNRNMNFLPVMFSLMVTSQSSILILGVPAEVYLFGYLAAFVGFGFWFAFWVAARIIIPVVHPLKITSINEYFELRYRNNRVRILTTSFSFMFWFIYLGIVTYGVSTAIQAVLGAPVWLSIVIVSTASMVYTALGGIKAVIWTDVIQYLIMVISVLAILIQGSIKVGGGSEVLRTNSNAGRLDIWNFSMDPTLRFTLWNVFIGNGAKLLSFSFSQSSVQRIGCMPSIKEAYKLFFMVAPLMTFTFILAGSMGLVAYAYFEKVRCDPLASKFIKNPNQLAQLVLTIPTGPFTGILLYSIFCTSATTAGAIIGGIVSFIFYLWMAIGNIMVEGFNKIYTLSFQWFDLIAIVLVIIIGLIVSQIVGAPKEEDVDASFSADPTLRFTIWNVIIGGTAKVIAFPFSQSSIQRIGCMSSRTDAYRMFIIVAPLMALTFLLAGGMGLVSYAYFADVRCDPLASKFISNPNQILPTLVSEIFQEHPGMMGLFIAGLFCASLSTVSSGYAALSSMTLQDIIKKKWTTLSDKKATYLSKITVVVFSILTTGMSLLLANVKGTLLKLAQMVLTIPMAPYAGIFLYSIFCTSATTAGAIVGGIVSLMFYLWMAIGNIVLSPPGVEKKLDPAPVDMCSENTTTYTNTTTPLAHGLNITGAAVSTTPAALEGFNKIYSLSFQWFDVIAILLVIIVGLIVSKIVGPPKEEVDARYVLNFTEQFFPCLPAKVKHVLSCGSTIPKRRRQIKEEKQKTQHIVLDTKPSEKHSDSSGPGQTGNDP